MNKEQRAPYLAITQLTPGRGLCCFCKHAEFSGSCTEVDGECHHPLTTTAWRYFEPTMWEDRMSLVWGENQDCWGFQPDRPLTEIAACVSIILAGNIPQMEDGELVAIIPNKNDLEAGYV